MNSILKFFLVFAICIALLICCTACEQYPNSEKISSDKTDYDANSSVEHLFSNNEDIPADTYIDYGYPFSEGLAFIGLSGEIGSIYSKTTYCINENGKIVFELAGRYTPVTNFINGKAILQKDSSEYFICDKNGKLKTADDFGADRFEVGSDKAGYIELVNTVTDYVGSFDKTAVANLDGDIIVDYKELRKNEHYAYYDGFICLEKDEEIQCYWDISTGAFYADGSNFVVPTKYASDWWQRGNRTAYEDVRTGKKVIDLNEYKDTIELYDFKNGYAPVLFTSVDSGNNAKIYFTALQENGEFYYEPICIETIKAPDGTEFTPSSVFDVIHNGDTVVALIGCYWKGQKSTEDRKGIQIVIFDTDGFVSNAFLEGSFRNAELSEDILLMRKFDLSYGFETYYYDLDGKLLF